MVGQDGFEYRSNLDHHEAQYRLGHLSAYYEWTLRLFGDRFDEPLADAGAGSGHFSSLLAQSGQKLVLLEGGTENLETLRDRFSMSENVSIVDCDLMQCESVLREHGVRSIFTLDVLEHLPDDKAALRQFYDALPSGGQLFIKVPALQWLYGPMDEASGHYRRYTKTALRRVVEASGFMVDQCFYMNLAGVAPYFLKSKVLKRRSNFSRTFSLKQIAMIRRIMPWLQIMDRMTGPPIGLSVVCIARRP